MDETEIERRLLGTATSLFAELGYDETTLGMIADTAGIPVTKVTQTFGHKRDLYLEVVARAAAMEDSVLAEAAAEFTPDAAGVRRFLDRYLSFYVANPHIASLWIQRRLHDAADIANIEGQYTTPQVKQVAKAVSDAVRPDIDIELCLWTVAWCVQDFVQGGIPDAQGHRIGHTDPVMLARFRAHLHAFVPRMIGLHNC